MTVLYFTATGNSLYVAKRLDEQLESIPQAFKHEDYIFSDDEIGLVFPVYWGSVSPYIQKFLSRVKLNSDYIFAVMTYGMYKGGVTSHLMKIAKEYNIHFSYINTILMVDNYLPTFNIEKQLATESKKQIDRHLEKIAADISSGKEWAPKDSMISRVMSKGSMLINKGEIGTGFTASYNIEDSCNGCGVCVKVCPADNIKLQNTRPVFGAECLSCLACTHNCPINAIRLESEKSKTRYRNQHISLKEIIEANE
ncbi:MAG: EFR1 family ferrodoxin [Actinobacteria bacterium]|nr:EFR1 family ferrodoxin [Actinomycetota bacterium]